MPYKNREDMLANKKRYYATIKNKQKIYYQTYRVKNKEAIYQSNKKYFLKKRYNLTLDQYNKMLSDQNNCCKVCDIKMISPHVDHCHTTGKVRALLCNNCNTGLGKLKEDTKIMQKLIEYVKEHNNE